MSLARRETSNASRFGTGTDVAAASVRRSVGKMERYSLQAQGQAVIPGPLAPAFDLLALRGIPRHEQGWHSPAQPWRAVSGSRWPQGGRGGGGPAVTARHQDPGQDDS